MSVMKLINDSFNKSPNKEIKENLNEKELDTLILENTNKLISIKAKYDEIKSNWKSLKEDMESLSMYNRVNCGEDIKEQFQKAISDLKIDYRDTKATLDTYKAQKNKLLLEDTLSEDPIIDESEEIINHLQDIIDTSDIYEVFKYLYNKLVPKVGPANTVAGEIIRALMAIMNGALRNNQVFYDGEGKDKFGSAFYYLTSKGYTDILEDAVGLTGDDYLSIIEKTIDRVARDLIANPELIKTQNIEDYTQFTPLGEDLAENNNSKSKEEINKLDDESENNSNIKGLNTMKILKESNSKDDKLIKINALYKDAIDYGINAESLNKIFYSNGANPDAPTFDIGLDVDKAYEELSDFLRKKYQSEFDKDYDDNNIPHDSYNILGFNKLAYESELERLNKEIVNLKGKYNINENKKELTNMRFLKKNNFSLTKDDVGTLLNEVATYADQLAEDARELTYSLDNGELTSIPKRSNLKLSYIEIKNRMEKILNSNMVESLKEGWKDFKFIVKCNDGPKELVRVVAENKSKAEGYAKDMYAANHTTYADDRYNEWFVKDVSYLKEALYGMNRIEQFVKMADAIGLKTMSDFKDFMDREGQGKDVLTALYDYLHNEIGDLEFHAKDESLKESYQDIDSMSREELMNEIDDIYSRALKGNHIDITSIIEDPEVFNSDDSDSEEGYFKGVPTDKLREVLKRLRKMLNDESLNECYLDNIKNPEYWQHQIDYQIEKFGRVGGGLIQDLDEIGFYLDADNKVTPKVKKESLKENADSEWTFIKSKEVEDSDGFLTDYTWYENSDGTQVMVFGDNDIYKPEDGYLDVTFTDRKQAEDWFNSY